MKTLFLTICLLLPINAWAAMNPDLTPFTKWLYVMQHEQLKPPAKPFTGDLLPMLQHMQDYYKQHYTYDDSTLAHWQTREEFKAHKKGACTDFAIAEYYDLLEKGVDPASMKIMIIYVKNITDYHSVLVVGDYVLDIGHSKVYDMAHFPDNYIPVFSINREGWERE